MNLKISGMSDATTLQATDKFEVARQGSSSDLYGTVASVLAYVQANATAFAPTSHTQDISTVNGLQAALDGKSDTGHTHSNATSGAAGFMSAADKVTLDTLVGSKYLGTFVDLAALQTAHPTAAPGSYARVDAGVGQQVVTYIWDDDDSEWVQQAGGGGGGPTNLSLTRNSTTVTVLSDTGTDAVLPAATASDAGVMVAADKSKLDGIGAGANVAKVGTPVDTRMAYWTGDGTLGHEAGFTYDPATDTLTVVKVTIGGLALDGQNQPATPSVTSAALWTSGTGTVYFPLGAGLGIVGGQLVVTDLSGTYAVAGHGHADATATTAGFMGASDKAKLDGIEELAKDDQTGSEIVSLINATIGTGWQGGGGGGSISPVAIAFSVDDAADTLDLDSTMTAGTFYWLADNTIRDEAYLEANGASEAISAQQTADIDLSSAPPGTLTLQGVLKTTTTARFSNIYLGSITRPSALSNGGTSNNQATSTDITFDTNLITGGRIYWGRYNSGSTPSATDVKNGTGTGFQGGTGNALPTDGTEMVAQTGLTAETAYTLAIVQYTGNDGTGEASNVLYVGWTTAASGSAQVTHALVSRQGGASPSSFRYGSNAHDFTVDVSAYASGTVFLISVIMHDTSGGGTFNATPMEIYTPTVDGSPAANSPTLLTSDDVVSGPANRRGSVAIFRWIKSSETTIVITPRGTEPILGFGMEIIRLTGAHASTFTAATAGESLASNTVTPGAALTTTNLGIAYFVSYGGVANNFTTGSWSGTHTEYADTFVENFLRHYSAIYDTTGANVTPTLTFSGTVDLASIVGVSVPPA